MDTIYRIAMPDDAQALARLNMLFNGPGCQTVDGARAALAAGRAETVFVAVSADEIVGFLCAQRLDSFCYVQSTVEFTELFVAEHARRQGIAGGLLAFAERWYRSQNVCEFRLLTGADNLGAQAFYANAGYMTNDEICYEKEAN